MTASVPMKNAANHTSSVVSVAYMSAYAEIDMNAVFMNRWRCSPSESMAHDTKVSLTRVTYSWTTPAVLMSTALESCKFLQRQLLNVLPTANYCYMRMDHGGPIAIH